MLRICFFLPSYSLQRRYQSVTILTLTKLVFGKGLEERLLHTSVLPKENQNRLKAIYFFFFLFFFSITLHCIKNVSILDGFAFLLVIYLWANQFKALTFPHGRTVVRAKG